MHRKSRLFRVTCSIVETDDNAKARQSAVTMGQWQDYANTVSAPAIARNAFDLGWELRMLSIVRDFAVEVAMRKPKNYRMMHSFLKSVEENIIAAQQKEEDFNVAAAVALSRAGLDAEICRMILPGKVRFMGLPLAVLPRYLKLA